MPVSSSRARQLAWVAFGVCCSFYVINAAVPVVAQALPGSRASGSLDLFNVIIGVVTLAFPVSGMLVARREPKNPVGWLMLTVGLVVAIPLSTFADYGLNIRPGALPGSSVAAALTAANWVPA